MKNVTLDSYNAIIMGKKYTEIEKENLIISQIYKKLISIIKRCVYFINYVFCPANWLRVRH